MNWLFFKRVTLWEWFHLRDDSIPYPNLDREGVFQCLQDEILIPTDEEVEVFIKSIIGIISKATMYRAEDRFRTADEMLESLHYLATSLLDLQARGIIAASIEALQGTVERIETVLTAITPFRMAL